MPDGSEIPPPSMSRNHEKLPSPDEKKVTEFRGKKQEILSPGKPPPDSKWGFDGNDPENREEAIRGAQIKRVIVDEGRNPLFDY